MLFLDTQLIGNYNLGSKARNNILLLMDS